MAGISSQNAIGLKGTTGDHQDQNMLINQDTVKIL